MEDIKFTEGLVRQAGYEEGRCKFVKLDENKTYYLVEDIEIGNDMYVVTPSVSEALKRTERKTVGIIDANGKVLVPCVNSKVAPINDMFIGVSRETLSDEEKRESIRAKIKRDLDGDIEFIIDDKSKYDIYKISEGSLELIYEGAVFVVESDGNILAQSEDANDKLVAIYENETKKETINESKPQMPVETFAKVNEKMTDSLEVPEMEEQKEGAPELRDEDIEESTTEVVDDIEFESSKEDSPEEEKQSDYFQISDIKNVSSIFEKKEPTSNDDLEESAEVEVEEKNEKEVDVKESSEIKEQMADIASLITAARNKVDGLEKDNDEKEKKIKELSSEIKNLEGEITSLNDDKIKQRKIIEEQKEVTEEQNKRITSLTSENKSLKENNVELTNKNKQLQSDKEELNNKISSLEKTLEQVYGEVYDAFSSFRSEDNKSYKKVA